VLILDGDRIQGFSSVHLYRAGMHRDAVALDSQLLAELIDGGAIAGHDFAFVTDPRPPAGVVAGELTVVGDDGNQAFAFGRRVDRDRLSLTLLRKYLPLRRFSGKALIVCGG
jgi:hypothetical protein